MTFEQSRDIKKFRPLIDTLIPDFDYVFLHTILLWCGLASEARGEETEYHWEVYFPTENDETIGICGLYSLKPNRTDELWLGWLAMIPTHRNGGKGKEVMSFLYEEARKLECKTIYSYVDKEGKPLSFYQREGFEIVGTVKEYLEANKLDKIDGENFESMEDYVIKKHLT